MSTIVIHPRIAQRHSNIKEQDVVQAMRSMFRYQQRVDSEWLAVGLDGNNRLIEMVYLYDNEKDLFFVFHAMTPPSGKTLRELRLER